MGSGGDGAGALEFDPPDLNYGLTIPAEAGGQLRRIP